MAVLDFGGGKELRQSHVGFNRLAARPGGAGALPGRTATTETRFCHLAAKAPPLLGGTSRYSSVRWSTFLT